MQSLRALIGATADDELPSLLDAGSGELAELLPELRERMPGIPEPTEQDPEGARFQLFQAVSSLLVRAGQRRPVVLVLDDLHAADEPSLLMLRFVVRELAHARALVLAAYRDIDPTPTDPLTVAVTELLREQVTQPLRLSGLRRDDVARFIELVSGEPASEDLVSSIHEETEAIRSSSARSCACSRQRGASTTESASPSRSRFVTSSHADSATYPTRRTAS